MIKNLSNKAYCQLNHIVNVILKLQYFQYMERSGCYTTCKTRERSTKADSYRPISLLNGLSKITEKIILHRLDKIESKLKIIPQQQFGFRFNHNTRHQAVRIITDIKSHFDKSQNTVLMLLDMQTAFDSLNVVGVV